MLWGAIAGTIPDLDIFLNLVTDEVTAAYLHRGFSHSIVFCILAAPLLGWLAHKIHKRGSPTRENWSWMFFWCLFTHPLLDIQTTYGTQLFWPFEARLAIKNVFVADPLYTLPFLLLLLLTMFFRRTSAKRRWFNKMALIVSSSYLILSLIFKGITYHKFKNALNENEIAYVTLDNQPTPLNILLWNAQVETENGYRFGYYSLFDSEEIEFLPEVPKNHELLNSYSDNKALRQLKKLSNGWYTVNSTDGGYIWTDMRFGQIGFEANAPYVWQYKIEEKPEDKLKISRYQAPPGDTTLSNALSGLLNRIKGN